MKTLFKSYINLNLILGKTTQFNHLIIRLTIATVIWPHGAQLLIGLFGGNGFSGTMDFFTNQLGIPYVISMLVVFIQFFGSLFILVGFFTRVNSILMCGLTIGMIFSGHVQHGFFMNWMGQQAGEGFEFHILLAGLCLSLILTGGGNYSADKIIFGKVNKNL